MKKFILFTQCALSLFSINTITMEHNQISYHLATAEHADKIVDVINKYAIEDREKIVILPEKFRKPAINSDITQKRLYCATNQLDEIVAFKKLFIINNGNEFNDIMHNEIRCLPFSITPIDTHTFNIHNKKRPSHIIPKDLLLFGNGVFIYFGGDYTIPAYRNQKINSHLISHSFKEIEHDIIKAVKKNSCYYIVLLYGLTKTNAGNNGGIDRTPSIVRLFKEFACHVTKQALDRDISEDCFLLHSRYPAFMPTFDSASDVCKPLPDDQAIPGYGNVLACLLPK